MKNTIKARLLELHKEFNYKLNFKSVNVIKMLQGFFGEKGNCIGTNNIKDYLIYYQMDLGKVKKYRMFIDGTEVYLREGYCDFYDREELLDITELFYYTNHIEENIPLHEVEKTKTTFKTIRQKGFEQTLREALYLSLINDKEVVSEYAFNLLYFWFVELYGYDKDLDAIKAPVNKYNDHQKDIKYCLDESYKFITLAVDDVDMQHLLNVAEFVNNELKGKVDKEAFDNMDVNLNETNFDQETTKLMRIDVYSYDDLQKLIKDNNLDSKLKYLIYYEAKKAFPLKERIDNIITYKK